MEKMKSTKQQAGQGRPSELNVHGYKVVVAKVGDKERLLIDGRLVKFHKTKAGYVLNANIYVEPKKTLMDAVKMYLKRRAR